MPPYKRLRLGDLLRDLEPELSALLLKPGQLAEILRDLGPKFSALSAEGRSALCASINEQFLVHQKLRKHLKDMTPHQRMGRWQQFERAIEKAQELLPALTVDMICELDRMRGDRRGATEPPTQAEVPEESFKIWSWRPWKNFNVSRRAFLP